MAININWWRWLTGVRWLTRSEQNYGMASPELVAVHWATENVNCTCWIKFVQAAADHQPAAANWQLPPGNWQVPPGFGSWFAPRSFAFACVCCYLRGLKDPHCICSYCWLATGGSAAILIAGTINFKPNFQMCPQVVNQWSHIHLNQW